MEREFTAVFEKHGRWYAAYVKEIPGVNAQGRTRMEAREHLKAALKAVLEVKHELSVKRRKKTLREPVLAEVPA